MSDPCNRRRFRAAVFGAACVVFAGAGCSWDGVNSLPLPGVTGRGPDATTLYVDMDDVGTLTPNSPVLIDDVVVGSIGDIRVENWHAVVEVSIQPGQVVPANAQARVGQTSLLGSMHLALNPPPGQEPEGRLEPGARIGLQETATYPSTEQTLASLSVVVNGGGLGQIGDIVGSLSAAFEGRETNIRSLLDRLDVFLGALDGQRADIVATIDNLNRLGGTFAGQRDRLTEALQKIPPALDVLIAERPDLVTALDRLRTFSDTTNTVLTAVHDDLLTNLRNLEPTLKALADVGPDINSAIQFATVFPYGQYLVDNGVRGDFINLFATVDLTIPRLRRELLLGTPWGDPTAVIQAAVGDPGYAEQTKNPLGFGITPPPVAAPAPAPAEAPAPPPPPAPAPVPVPGLPFPLPQIQLPQLPLPPGIGGG
ncbi:MCE family protein [Nocardia sp. NPDC024068]|uniref:MCE family protein n=1 Tax=Nocardia sp. NPDC024068 TaxID=3157197 RepID=UPI003406893E